jgi:hypothetical protein
MTLHLIDAGPSGAGWSSRESQLTCPQRYSYRKHLPTHPDVYAASLADNEALIKGALVHVGLAHYYTHVQGRQNSWDTSGFFQPADAIAESARRHDHERAMAFGDGQEAEADGYDLSKAWTRHVPLAQETLVAYADDHYNERMRILAIEHRVELPIEGESFLGAQIRTVFTARIDLIVQQPDASVVFIDHKTTYKVDEKKKRGFGLLGALLGHHVIGRRAYGDNFAGVRLNMIGLRPGSQRFKRFPPEPAPFAMGEMEQQLIDRQAIIDQLDASGRDPWRYPKALSEQGPCEDRYGPCPFRDLCRWGPRS